MSKLFEENKPHKYSQKGLRLESYVAKSIEPLFEELWEFEGCNRAEIMCLFTEAISWLSARKSCHIDMAEHAAKKTTSNSEG